MAACACSKYRWWSPSFVVGARWAVPPREGAVPAPMPLAAGGSADAADAGGPPSVLGHPQTRRIPRPSRSHAAPACLTLLVCAGAGDGRGGLPASCQTSGKDAGPLPTRPVPLPGRVMCRLWALDYWAACVCSGAGSFRGLFLCGLPCRRPCSASLATYCRPEGQTPGPRLPASALDKRRRTPG